jgi:hypothetical protein
MNLPTSPNWQILQGRIGAELPNHQVWLFIDHVVLEARNHLRGVLPVDAAIEHGDRRVRVKFLEFHRESAWI